MKMMRLVLAIAAWSCLAACGAAADAAAPVGKLDEANVRTFVEAVEAATRDQDVDASAAMLADEAIFTMHVPEGQSDGPNPLVMDKQEMVQDMREEKSLQRDRTYASTIESISVDADGKRATADLTVTTDSEIEGVRAEIVSDQTYTIELRGDRPLITAVEVTITGLSVDGEKQF